VNIYEIKCAGWRARVKAASWPAAINRGLGIILTGDVRKAHSSKKTDSITVHARLLLRDIPHNTPIPPWEEDRK